MVTSRREKAKVQEKGIEAARRSCAKALVLVPLDSLYQLKSNCNKRILLPLYHPFLFLVPCPLWWANSSTKKYIQPSNDFFFFWVLPSHNIPRFNWYMLRAKMYKQLNKQQIRKMLTDVEVVFERSLILKMNNLSCRSIYCTYII